MPSISDLFVDPKELPDNFGQTIGTHSRRRRRGLTQTHSADKERILTGTDTNELVLFPPLLIQVGSFSSSS